MGQFNWQPPATDEVVTPKKSNWTPPATDKVVSEKKNGSNVSSTGSKTSPDFLHKDKFTPTPADVKTKQGFDNQEQNFDKPAPKFDLNVLKQYQQHYDRNLYDPNNPEFKQHLEAQQKSEKDAYSNGRSWKNLPVYAPRQTFASIEKDIGDAMTYLGGHGGYNPGFSLVTNAIANSAYGQAKKDQQAADAHQLPGTEGGYFMTGVSKMGGDILETAALPEGEFSKLGKYGSKAAKLLFGRFPIQQGVKGLVSNYADAKKNGATEDEANKASYKGLATGYGEGLGMEVAGLGAGKLTELGIKPLEEAGLMSANKFVAGAQKRLIHATAQGMGFSAIPFVENAIQGKPTDIDEARKQGAFGAILGAITGHGGDADAAAAKVIRMSPEIDLHNFMNTDIPAIVDIHNSPISAEDMRAKSTADAEQGFQAEDAETKQNHVIQSSISGKGASVKSIADAILNDKDALLEQVNKLPEEQRQPVLDKIDEVHKQLLGKQISDLDTQIASFKEKSDDPIKNAENEVNLEEAEKKREELNNNLKKIIQNEKNKPQSENNSQEEGRPGQQVAERPEEAQQNQETVSKEPDVVQGGDGPPLKEDNAVQVEKTEGVPVQSTPGDSEAVGEKGKEEKETSDAGEKSKEEKLTGITNAKVEQERGEEVPREKKKLADVDKEGKRLVDSGEVDPEKLARDISKGKHVATEEEQASLRYHKAKLENRQDKILKDSEENPERATENHLEFERTEALLEENRAATEEIGRRAGITLRDRQEMLKRDYSRVRILNRAKQANGGEALSPELEQQLKDSTARIKKLESDLSDREEHIRKLQEQSSVNRVGEIARRTRKEVTRTKLREERADLLATLHTIAKKSRSELGANKIPLEMIEPLTKLAINYVHDGINTLSMVVDKVYNDIKDHVDGVSREDVSDAIKEGFDKAVKEDNDKRLSTAKKRQQTKLESLKEQNETGTIEERTQKKLQVDNDYLKIRADINREQAKINKKIADIANSKKEVGRKVVDFAVKWGRWAKLASITVLGKLAAAGLTTLSVKIPEELLGAGLSKILPRIAKKADFEAGANFKELARSYAKAATQGMKDAADEMNIKKSGQSDISALYGKEVAGKLPPEAADFWGHLHSAIKAPFKRAIFEYSYAKRFEAAARKGLDPIDPTIDAQNRLNAYKDANRAIFMGDNKLSSAYEAGMRTLENSSSTAAQNTAALFRILLPFVKVPTNIALEGSRYAFGSLSALKLARVGISDLTRKAGAEKLAYFFHKGMGELKPEEAEQILNNLKKGSVGGAALLLGFYNPKSFGGFYRPGKKEKGQPEEGGIRVFGTDVPRWMTEHPVFLAMQVGATFRQVLDAHRRKQDGVEAATLATASGLAQAVPLANGAEQILGALNSTGKANQMVGNIIKGEVEPALINQLATITDTKDKSTFSLNPKNQQKRAPDKKHGLLKYVKEDLETGIPGLRQNVKPKK